jgi:PAS domain S-box-containing protein
LTNQKRFIAAFTHASIGMAVVQPCGRINKTNNALRQLRGCDEALLLGRRFDELLHPGDAALLRRRIESMAPGNGEPLSMELRCRAAAGEIARARRSFDCRPVRPRRLGVVDQ